VHAAVNRIRLKEPVDDEVFVAAQRDLPGRIAGIDGVRAFHLVRCGNDELLVVIVGDSEGSLDRLRVEIGSDWMRENVVPRAAGPPERMAGQVVMSYERG
jgi:hypothetical protein